MGVSKNRGTPKSSILIEFSIINHPFWGTPIFGSSHMKHQQQIVHERMYPDLTSFPPHSSYEDTTSHWFLGTPASVENQLMLLNRFDKAVDKQCVKLACIQVHYIQENNN